MSYNTAGKPTEPGKKVGETRKTKKAQAMGTKADAYFKWDGSDWVEISKHEYDGKGTNRSYTTISPAGLSSTTGSLRYPKDAAMAKESDYVLFEFFEYVPPFKGINKGAAKDGGDPLSVYNQSATDASKYNKTLKSVILYMPEDISTGYRANWSGKAFSNIGRDVMATAGSTDLGQVIQNGLNFTGDAASMAIHNTGEKTIAGTISKITGESVSNNDVFGGLRGVILNPNVELLFGGTDLRNFALNYKLVPRNEGESSQIKQIINQFRKAMLPSFGNGSDIGILGMANNNDANNFIKVPNVCRVTFMRGGSANPDVPQYKMCAITQVDINYTPDGTYATYGDGSMVAIQLSLNFQETKLIFANEVEKY